MNTINPDIQQALQTCLLELAQLTQFRYAALTQLNSKPTGTCLLVRLAWYDGEAIETPDIELTELFWSVWTASAHCQSLSSPAIPPLLFEKTLTWQVQNLIFIPLRSLAAQALGGLLLLHDQKLLNQQELLKFAKVTIGYMALLLEQDIRLSKLALSLNTLCNDVRLLQADALVASRHPTILAGLAANVTAVTQFYLQSIQPEPIFPSKNSRFNLRQLLDRFASAHTEQQGCGRLDVHISPETALAVQGDERILSQMLWNLYHQAHDFYQQTRFFSLYVLVLEHAHPEVYLKFSIRPAVYEESQTAPPPSRETVRRIYWRSQAATKLSPLLGGEVCLAPEQQQSSLWFSARLKRDLSATSPGASPAVSALMLMETAPASSSEEWKNFRILVAEDSPINQTVIQKMLYRLGYPNDLVDNGLKVLEAWQNGDYQLILMDCEMPELDGYDAAAEIRKREQVQGGHIPIIALTAHALAEHRERSRVVGMDEHLSKPINLPVLKEVLDSWERRVSQGTVAPARALPAATPLSAPLAAVIQNNAIDYKTLNALRQVLGDNFAKIIYQFLDYAPHQLNDLRTARAHQDQEALRSKAHQFKGEAAQIGALELAGLCKAVEMLARSGNIEATSHLIERIQIELQNVVVSLNHELNLHEYDRKSST